MRNAGRIRSTIVAAFLAGCCASFAAHQVTSEYTKTAKGVVRHDHLDLLLPISQSKPKVEMGWSVIRHKGLGGYDLIVTYEDSRSWVDLQYGGKTVDLRQATFDLAPGRFPNKANEVVEWRGLVRESGFVPFAIIYRLSGQAEQTNNAKTRLIVIHLNGLRSRVAGFTEGKNEDADAKKIADRLKP